MYITGSLINSYFICPRKTWLFAHQFLPDPENDFLEIGRLITEEAFKRDKKEIEIAGMKIDILKRRGGKILIGEIKKSSKGLKAGIMQLAFYLYQLKKQGIILEGELLIPKERKRIPVKLNSEIEVEIEKTIEKIKEIINCEKPPPAKRITFCKFCAYSEFCWTEV